MQMRTTTRLVLALAGASLALTGTVLLLKAAWGGLALAFGPLWAFAILGGSLALLGGLLLLGTRGATQPKPAPAPTAAMFEAFFDGLRAGRATRSRGH